MTTFQPVKTTRIDLRLSELTIRQARAVCEINPRKHEATVDRFLRYVTGFDTSGIGLDPMAMSVQERAMLVCQYLSVVLDDGPDFSVGTDMHLSDFLDLEADSYPDEVVAGEIEDEPVYMGQLLGRHVVDLESICKSRADWIIGMMACQIRIASEPPVDVLALTEAQRLGWLDGRIEAISSMPESQAAELYDTIFVPGQQKLRHFFDIAVDGEGICFQGGEEVGYGLGRFQPTSGISKRTREIFC